LQTVSTTCERVAVLTLTARRLPGNHGNLPPLGTLGWQEAGRTGDLAFSYIDAKAYQELKELVDKKRRTHEAFLAEITKIFEEKLKESDIPCFHGIRESSASIRSIQKLKKQRITIDRYSTFLH